MPYVETLSEFIAQHGEHIAMPSGWYLFADGAAVQADDGFGRLSSRRDPPIEPMALLRAKRAFLKAKHDLEVDQFNRFKAVCAEQASIALRFPLNCPPAPANAPAQLAAGRERIESMRKQLAEMDAKLSLAPSIVARREDEESQRAQRERRAQELRAIEAVTLQ